ncbi:hypothetical protein E2986_14126 [Frieseomelitta varia]|uniref:Uncharacterized protein n=1 Tax=Frieseomelitta varia TaxID=561572 RepID=A0A833RPL7_9HYME|nr:hypothetical protein E2986_14126 [Frieseomelitta varia]
MVHTNINDITIKGPYENFKKDKSTSSGYQQQSQRQQTNKNDKYGSWGPRSKVLVQLNLIDAILTVVSHLIKKIIKLDFQVNCAIKIFLLEVVLRYLRIKAGFIELTLVHGAFD